MLRLLAQLLVLSLLSFFSNPHVTSSANSSSFHNSSSTVEHLCSPDESLTLFLFKNSFSVDNSTGLYNSFGNSYPRTESWKNGTDCCSWDGVTCDRRTGHVTGLDLSSSYLVGVIHDNSSLFLLSHLRRLNLAHNDFSESKISSNFGRLSRLRHLNLSSSDFAGLVPIEIPRHLSKLVSLDLSRNYDLELNQQSFNEFLQNLTELRHLSLDHTNMSSVVIESLANVSNSQLMSLSLASCSLQGKFPASVLSKLKQLTRLDLRENQLSDELPDVFGNLSSLTYIDLSGNKFFGQLPPSIFNITQLSHLDLSLNRFTGTLPPHISGLSNLTNLLISTNSITGQLPSWLFGLPSLEKLNLEYNNLTGTINQSQQGNNFSLRSVDLKNNELHGPVPDFLFERKNLSHLDLSFNKLSGILRSDMFAKLPNLESVALSNVSLLSSTDTANDKFTLPNLKVFSCASCNMTEIPSFLLQAQNLTELDLPNNRISGRISLMEIEQWKNLASLDLSQNLLTGFEINASLTSLQSLNLGFNLLQGPVVVPPPSLVEFSLSQNRLTGNIPSSVCNLTSLQILLLSNNFLRGTIPQCLISHNIFLMLDLGKNNFTGSIPQTFTTPNRLRSLVLSDNQLEGPIPRSLINCTNLKFLDLGNNKIIDTFPHWLATLLRLEVLTLNSNGFYGTVENTSFPKLQVLDISHNKFVGKIPSSFSKGNTLLTLKLNHNELEGPLPRSLADCSLLEVLDIGNNKISDTFPHWLAVLPELQVLVLRANKFHGPIRNSRARFPFPKLRIIDISQNGFIGPLSSLFLENLKAMVQVNNNTVEQQYMRHESGFRYYHNSILLTMKGIDVQMERILTIFTTIDLSNNHFEGSIPEVIGNLNSLKVLNFSHNNLAGQIPLSLGSLTAIESLDISSNKLVGEIPRQLSMLNWLSVFNISYNRLVGPIPQGSQLNTFNNNSYIGNLDLCGLPLSKKCGSSPLVPPTTNEEEDDTWKWFWRIVMMGYGSGLVVGVSTTYIVFLTGKPFWVIKMYERLRQLWKKERRPKGRRGVGRRN